ncbi:MAG: hypothetical protein IJX88_04375 [Clostridia bacterium]|nr:hypothetical protein [Clostridia bacterium]
MSAWKKRWKRDLDMRVPDLREDIKNASIPETEEKLTVWQRFCAWLERYKRRVVACVASGVAVIVGLCVTLPHLKNDTSITPSVTASGSVVALQINPEVLFSVDGDGMVTAVASGNADADVILSDETRLNSMKGVPVYEATAIFTDYAAKLGFLELTAKPAVRVLTHEGKTTWNEEVKNGLESYFKTKGVYGVVVDECLRYTEFCEATGLPASQKAEEIVSGVRALQTLYTKRVAEDKSGEELKTLYGEFVAVEEFGAILDIMEALGMDVTALRELLILPTTIVEYGKKIDAYLVQQFADLEKKHNKAYKEVRAEISDNEYAAHLQSIVEEYGSISAYWASLQK